MKKILIGFLLTLFAVFICSFDGYCSVRVIDGDTVVINGEKHRLYGIDAPELSQKYGKYSKEMLEWFLKGNNILTVSEGKDKYGRNVSMIYVDGESVNSKMIISGSAWVYQRYCMKDICYEWRKIEIKNKNDGVGIFKFGIPEKPWKYRYRKKHKRMVIYVENCPFVGNTKTKIYHKVGCRYYNCKYCRECFFTEKEAITEGYHKCKLE